MSTSGTESAIKKSVNNGDINISIEEAQFVRIGGIIPEGRTNTVLKNIYNKGNIEISLAKGNNIIVGGIIGETCYGTSDVSNGYSYGKIKINSSATNKHIGTICGVNNINIALKNLYYSNNTGYSGIGKNDNTSTQIEQINENNKNELVDKLNIGTDNWKQDSNNINNGYPILEWQQ